MTARRPGDHVLKVNCEAPAESRGVLPDPSTVIAEFAGTWIVTNNRHARVSSADQE